MFYTEGASLYVRVGVGIISRQVNDISMNLVQLDLYILLSLKWRHNPSLKLPLLSDSPMFRPRRTPFKSPGNVYKKLHVPNCCLILSCFSPLIHSRTAHFYLLTSYANSSYLNSSVLTGLLDAPQTTSCSSSAQNPLRTRVSLSSSSCTSNKWIP